MATITDAGVRPLFPTIWDTQVLQARYAAAVIEPRILSKSAMVKEYGENVNITVKPRVSGGTVATDGTFTPEAITLTQVQINVNTWRQVSHIITDKQSAQAIVELESELPKQFGERLAEFTDTDLANLFLSLTGGNTQQIPGIGYGDPSKGVNFDEDTCNSVLLTLVRRNIPQDGMSWILSPESYHLGWLKKERFTSVMHTGEAKSLLTTGINGYKQDILGIPSFMSNLLNGGTGIDDSGNALNAASAPNLPGTTTCALIHREALAVAIQINSKTYKMSTVPALQFATVIASNNLYGTRVVRGTHGVPIYIANS